MLVRVIRRRSVMNIMPMGLIILAMKEIAGNGNAIQSREKPNPSHNGQYLGLIIKRAEYGFSEFAMTKVV